MNDAWESAFVAVTVAMGDSIDEATAALGPHGAARASDVTRGLRAPSRGTRAGVLATALAQVAREIDRMELR